MKNLILICVLLLICGAVQAQSSGCRCIEQLAVKAEYALQSTDTFVFNNLSIQDDTKTLVFDIYRNNQRLSYQVQTSVKYSSSVTLALADSQYRNRGIRFYVGDVQIQSVIVKNNTVVSNIDSQYHKYMADVIHLAYLTLN